MIINIILTAESFSGVCQRTAKHFQSRRRREQSTAVAVCFFKYSLIHKRTDNIITIASV